jgi:hypothetical protein
MSKSICLRLWTRPGRCVAQRRSEEKIKKTARRCVWFCASPLFHGRRLGPSPARGACPQSSASLRALKKRRDGPTRALGGELIWAPLAPMDAHSICALSIFFPCPHAHTRPSSLPSPTQDAVIVGTCSPWADKKQRELHAPPSLRLSRQKHHGGDRRVRRQLRVDAQRRLRAHPVPGAWVGVWGLRALRSALPRCVERGGRAFVFAFRRAARTLFLSLAQFFFFQNAHAPTQPQAQADAVNLLAGAKTQANPENAVGVLTMAGKAPRVLVTPTPDLGRVLNAMQVRERGKGTGRTSRAHGIRCHGHLRAGDCLVLWRGPEARSIGRTPERGRLSLHHPLSLRPASPSHLPHLSIPTPLPHTTPTGRPRRGPRQPVILRPGRPARPQTPGQQAPAPAGRPVCGFPCRGG